MSRKDKLYVWAMAACIALWGFASLMVGSLYHQSIQAVLGGGWGIVAIAAAVVAKCKKRSAVRWFLATLLLGPLAMTVLLLSGTARHEAENSLH